jgi:hypothetical protein
MTDPVQEQLLGHLLGVLDDDEQQQIETRLKDDPHLARQAAQWTARLEMLEACRAEFPPPPALAERTCRFVVAQAQTAAAEQSLGAAAGSSGWAGRVGWLDLAMAAGVFMAAALLTIPAILTSRFNARVAVCQDNLRQLGVALGQYSEQHDGFFPYVPAEGKLAGAGIYAPVLLRDGFLTEARRVICPDSPLAEQREFHVPSIDALERAEERQAERMRRMMGGSYGYSLGHMREGRYQGTKNLGRTHFALMADAPSSSLPGHQTVNHGGRGQNVLFEDGRVDYVLSPRPHPNADDIFANDRGEVAAGLHRNDAVVGPSSAVPVIYVNNR